MSAPLAIELLAPARDAECGIAALDHGADAVYVGATDFGARAAAGNSIETLLSLIQYAHRYWARVYVTLNTILTDEELPRAEALARQLWEAHADGFIVQDVGLLESLLTDGLPVIASTQAHNATPSKVQFWEQLGLKRVILARELSIQEIAAIRRAAPRIELECFVHGALCVSYSGQCYLSYALGGRSGNRGDCAQPCRKSYAFTNAHGEALAHPGHLLSLRDLDLSPHLDLLLDAGVTSFKIEGRLKDRAYVSTVVSYYRHALDRLIENRGLTRASSGVSEPTFNPDPTRVFARGQTSYFLMERPRPLSTPTSAKSLGQPIGPVRRVRGSVVILEHAETSAEIHPGDGIVFFDDAGSLRGSAVNRVSESGIELQTPNGIAPGTELRRNLDARYLDLARRSSPRRTIPTTLRLDEVDGKLCLMAQDADGVTATETVALPHEPAHEPERARAIISRQLQKSGDTEFSVANIDIVVSPVPHLPLSMLNALRRNLFTRLREIRLLVRPTPPLPVLPPAPPRFPEEQLSYRGNVLNQRAKAFYTRHGVARIEPAAESGLSMEGRIVVTMRYCLLHELGYCPKQGGELPRGEPYYLDDAEGNRLRLHFDCRSCICELELVSRSARASVRRQRRGDE